MLKRVKSFFGLDYEMGVCLLPGRYASTVRLNTEVDDNAIVGFDEAMETYFLQAFEGVEGPRVWLGTSYREFHSFDALCRAARKRGIEVWLTDDI